jgi:hypothetical protein
MARRRRGAAELRGQPRERVVQAGELARRKACEQAADPLAQQLPRRAEDARPERGEGQSLTPAVVGRPVARDKAGRLERPQVLRDRGGRDGRPVVCAVCALLTATVSLDGAVVLMVPLVYAHARRTRDLARPLLLGTIAVANAFSLAVPQGNPTNIVVSRRLGLSSQAFVARLFVPALLATFVVVLALAIVERRSLSGRFRGSPAAGRPLSRDEWIAAGALAAAAMAGASAPWLGVSAWWPVCGVAGAAWVVARVVGAARPAASVQLRIGVQIGALVARRGRGRGRHPVPASVRVAGGAGRRGAAAAIAAGALNNLPASVVLARLLGGQPLAAYATLAGPSVGALPGRRRGWAATSGCGLRWPLRARPSRRRRSGCSRRPDAQRPSSLAITMRCTSFVPSPISRIFWSR